jgi:hypothetical protein
VYLELDIGWKEEMSTPAWRTKARTK